MYAQVYELQKFILIQTLVDISKSFSIRTCVTLPFLLAIAIFLHALAIRR